MVKNDICYSTGANQILPGLWLGNYITSYNKDFLDKNNITHILSIMPNYDDTKKHKNITYLHIPIKDVDVCSKNLNDLYNITSDYINGVLSNKQNILIHCKNGHHRSASVVVAFLLKYLKLDYVSALVYVNYNRPCALRRETCMKSALINYYISLL